MGLFPGAAASPQLNVMHLIDVTGRGGAERVLVDLALHLDRRRYSVTVCATRHTLDYQPLLDRAGVRTLVLGRRSRWDLLRLAGLVRELRERPIHILHSHLFGSNVWGRLLGRLAGVPVIVAHEHWSSRPRAELWIDRALYRLGDAIIVASEASRRVVAEQGGIPAARLTVVPNGVALAASPDRSDSPAIRREFGIAPEALLIGSVGRLSADKGGQDTLIRAVARLSQAEPRTRLLLVGDGPLRPSLEALAGALLPAGVVQFAGKRNDVPRLLRALDLFALPSLREALPLAILEAMGAAVPVVASAVGGIPEVIEDGTHGLLVPAGDEFALAGALGRLLGEPALRGRLGAAGRARVEAEFTVERMTRRVEALYEDLVRRKLPAAAPV